MSNEADKLAKDFQKEVDRVIKDNLERKLRSGGVYTTNYYGYIVEMKVISKLGIPEPLLVGEGTTKKIGVKYE